MDSIKMNYILDVTHTSHCYTNTGIQRVVRNLHHALAQDNSIDPICYDPYAEIWRCLDSREKKLMSHELNKFKNKRKARWTFGQKAISKAQKFFNTSKPYSPKQDSVFIAPEIFSPVVFKNYHELFRQVHGPKVAIFYDAIALQLPQYTPQKTVARMPLYLEELAGFDGVAAISQASADALKSYWHEQGIYDHPPVVSIHLASELFSTKASNKPLSGRPKILCVSTIEGRKNHLALLNAAEILWDEGLKFDLHLIGIPAMETGSEAVTEITRLIAKGYSLKWDQTLNDHELRDAYENTRFTVYPSLMEGFGLPILESLQREKPVVCSGEGAMGEIAKHGGCLSADVTSPKLLAIAMRRLLSDEILYEQLVDECRERHYKTWTEYAGEIKSFARDLALQKQKTTGVLML